MGRKLDLSGLSDLEAAHVLQVVQRDMRLRKREEERLCELKQELDEEGSRCHLLSRQSCFNQRCCIRCCAPFTFLLNPKRPCGACGYNVCRRCRAYDKKSKGWLCTSCQKHRLLKTQSLEWFYTNVKRRFKRFGSAKVLKTLYRKHLTEHSILSELTDGSGYEESVCNDGSVCGSDSTFYRQSEEHSMSETLTVARRVAAEAIDEAISKAEVDIFCQEKQNEAHYLQEHRGELIEELAKTIVQKIIVRRKTLAQIKSEYDQNLTHTYYDHFVPPQPPGLWRSHSLSLLDTDCPSATKAPLHSLKKESAGPSLSAWKSVDRLDNSVLKSPDGNWIALQTSPLSRPGLLTKRKSLVYSALERESGAVSAYEALDSDSEIRPEPDSSWGAALREIHKKMTSSDLLEDLDLDYVGGRRGSADFEGNYWKSTKALINKKVPVEIRKPSSSRRTSIIDVNFNMEAGDAGDAEEETKVEVEKRRVKRPRRKRRSKKEAAAQLMQDSDDNGTPHFSDDATPETLTSGATTPEPGGDFIGLGANQTNRELTVNLQQFMGHANFSDSSTNLQNSEHNSGHYMDLDEGELDKSDDVELDSEAKDKLFRLVAQSRLMYLSSTDDDLDKAGVSEEDDAQMGTDLKFALCRLEQEVKSTQFSSTEDELDRICQDEVPRQEEEEEELAVRVCKLDSLVNATQFSSTEDELERTGSAEEALYDSTLWRSQAERGEHVRDIAGLVSICQFSSTEDELDRSGQDDIAQNEVNLVDFERRESIGDLDVDMFELREDLTTGNYLEMSKAANFEIGQDTEGVDFADVDGGESIGDFDVSMFEPKDKEMNSLEGSGEQNVIDNAIESEITLAKFKSQEGGVSQETLAVRQDEDGEFGSDSEEDEAEFNRIINSMLMLTLEDMQMGGQTVETQEEEPADDGVGTKGAEDGETRENSSHGGEGGIGEAGSETPAPAGSGKSEQSDVELGVNAEDDALEKVDGMQNKPEETEAQMTRSKDGSSNQVLSGIFQAPEGLLSPEEIQKSNEFVVTRSEQVSGAELSHVKARYSAESLRSITTEVLKVLNATERILQDKLGQDTPPAPSDPQAPNKDCRHLDQQLCRLEENVYVAAGSVYGLEAELDDLEECSRAVSSSTSHSELCFLEEQVATAAAKVQQSEMQISDISARIAALRSAGLDLEPQPTIAKPKSEPAKFMTLDRSRLQRRLLPAPPSKDAKES